MCVSFPNVASGSSSSCTTSKAAVLLAKYDHCIASPQTDVGVWGRTELVPFARRRRSVVFVQWAHAEAAARFEQVRSCQSRPKSPPVHIIVALKGKCLSDDLTE